MLTKKISEPKNIKYYKTLTFSNLSESRICLYNIFAALCTQAAKTLAGCLYAFHHQHKVTPFHAVAACLLIIVGQFEASGFQTLDIHHHAAVLGMKQFHKLQVATYEDEHVTVTHLTLHTLMYYTAQRTDSLAHVCVARAQPVPHGVVKAEHPD